MEITDCIEDLVNLAKKYQPDVILLDLLLNNGDCTKQIKQLSDSCPQSKILAFSEDGTKHMHVQCVRLGVVGFISKYHSIELLLEAIQTIHNSQTLFDRVITEHLGRSQFSSDQQSSSDVRDEINIFNQMKLTVREYGIAYLACRGYASKAIATELEISERTVRNNLYVIYKKWNVKTKVV